MAALLYTKVVGVARRTRSRVHNQPVWGGGAERTVIQCESDKSEVYKSTVGTEGTLDPTLCAGVRGWDMCSVGHSQGTYPGKSNFQIVS